MGSQRQRHLPDWYLLGLERTTSIQTAGYRERRVGNQASPQDTASPRPLQAVGPLERRAGRTHTRLGYPRGARPRDLYLLGSDLGPQTVLYLHQDQLQTQDFAPAHLRMPHRYGPAGGEGGHL